MLLSIKTSHGQINTSISLVEHINYLVCSTEPTLQPITGEVFNHATTITEDGARLDIAANGFWGSRLERAFFDVRVFNPHVPSNQRHTLLQVIVTTKT